MVILAVVLAALIALYLWAESWPPSCFYNARQYDPTGELCDFT